MGGGGDWVGSIGCTDKAKKPRNTDEPTNREIQQAVVAEDDHEKQCGANDTKLKSTAEKPI